MFNVSIEAPTISEALPVILHELKRTGVGESVESRNGKTLELPMARIHLRDPNHNPYNISPARKASLPAQIAETIWVLSGRNDIKFIERYLKRASEFSDDGETWRGGYGPRIRNWGCVDQLSEVSQLLISDPNSRRAVINLFDPAEDLGANTKDVPCNNWLSFIIRDGKLHTHVAVRSNDAFWGLSGINAFEWTFLGQVLAYLVGVEPGSLTFSTTSLHLYEPHWDRAAKIAEEGPLSWAQPAITFGKASPGYGAWTEGRTHDDRWFAFVRGLKLMEEFLEKDPSDMLDFYKSHFKKRQTFLLFDRWARAILAFHGEIKAPVNSIDPMWKSLELSPRTNEVKVVDKPAVDPSSFDDFVSDLHFEKNKAYGNSWMKRGEMLGIMANIARKIDRLGKPGAGDAELDTTVDLMLYLAKYQLWNRVQLGYGTVDTLDGSYHHEKVMQVVLQDAAARHNALPAHPDSVATLHKRIEKNFEILTEKVENRAKRKNIDRLVGEMLDDAYTLALRAHRTHVLSTKQFTGYDV